MLSKHFIFTKSFKELPKLIKSYKEC